MTLQLGCITDATLEIPYVSCKESTVYSVLVSILTCAPYKFAALIFADEPDASLLTWIPFYTMTEMEISK